MSPTRKELYDLANHFYLKLSVWPTIPPLAFMRLIIRRIPTASASVNENIPMRVSILNSILAIDQKSWP